MHKYLKPSSSAVSSLGGNCHFGPVKYYFADFSTTGVHAAHLFMKLSPTFITQREL